MMGLALMIINSCKKGDDSNNPTPTSSKKLQTVHYSSGLTTTYEYNSDGKVSKIIEGAYGGRAYYYTFTYSGNIITTTIVEPSGNTSNDASTLNSQGYISKTEGTSGSVNYEYDNSGYLTKEIFSDNQGKRIVTYAYTNGNCTSKTSTQGADTTLTTYEYYLEKENALSSEMLFGEKNHYGRSNKNLIKSTAYSSSHSDFYSSYTYEYEYDQDNYVTKQTTTDVDGKTSWATYSYK